MTINRKQIALIHVIRAKLAWDDELYREVLVKIGGVTTSTELTQQGFEAVLAYAEHCGFTPLARETPRYGNRPGMATHGQLALIRELWREVHGTRDCDDAALTGWLLKYHKVSSLRFLTMDAARKVITGLKAWKTRPKAKAA